MNPQKHCSLLCGLLLLILLLPGCDDVEERTPEQPAPLQVLPSALDKPKFVENFTISAPHRGAKSDTVETTVECNPVDRVPLTVQLTAFQVVNKKSHWTFHIVNHDSHRWDGNIRIFLLSHGEAVDSVDIKTNKPIEPAYLAAPGSVQGASLDSTVMPTALQGNVDQYGWAFEVKTSSSPAPVTSSLPKSDLPLSP